MDQSLPATPRVAPERLAAAVEAVLLSVQRAVSASALSEGLGLGPDGAARVREAVAGLNDQYQATGRSFRIEEAAGGYRVMTLPELAREIAGFHASRAPHRLTRAAIETLAVVAYRQPITRAQIESVRGCSCGEVLKTLVERRLVTIRGRAEELGRPILYGTTREFLEVFGISSIRDLPDPAELQLAASAPAAS